MTTPILDGLIVLERAGRLAGAAGASLLAELGATVIRVEDPSLPPPREPEAWRTHPLALAGKRRVRLSDVPAEATAQWQRLEDFADVVITSPPLPAISTAPDGPIRCDVSAFGSDGDDLPDDAGEAILQAVGGMMSTTGSVGGPPEFIGAPLIELYAALNVVTSVLAALRVRETGAPAVHSDISLFDSSVSLIGAFVGHAVIGKGHGMRGGSRHPLCCPWNAYPTRDGWVLMCSSTEPHWKRILELIGQNEFRDDPRFETMATRMQHRDAVDAMIADWTQQRTTSETVDQFQAVSLPAGQVFTVPELLQAPDGPPTREISTLDGPRACPAGLFKMSDAPGVIATEIRAEIEAPESIAATPRTRALPVLNATTHLPLHGVRVIEVGVFTAGPLGGRYLADLGAEVIKIEQMGGENGRAWEPNFGGVSAYFATYNVGKRSVTLDMQSEDGKAALAKLVASADVLVQNLKAGAMDRMGFGPAALLQRHPRLIYCSISGYGSTGSKVPALDTVVQGQSGLMSLIQTRDEPVKAGLSVADVLASHISPPAIMAALRHRDATGRGQHIDISMRDALAWTTQLSWPGGGSALTGVCRLDCTDGWTVAECPAAEARGHLGDDPSTLTCDAMLATLKSAGVTAAKVLELDDILTHPASRKRRLFREAATEGGIPAPVLAAPFRFDGKPLEPGSSVPVAGEYNAMVAEET
ncbi:MAG: CoA transferase [Alphaproteobacteria bacterium]|nr:CoA transferase [Alphaproteobacteria bacterium]